MGMDQETEHRLSKHEKRLEDKLRDCKKDVDAELETIALSIKQLQSDIQAMRDILEAWNNMKGFASGMRFFSTAIKILTPIVVFFGGVYWFFHTGQWPNDKG